MRENPGSSNLVPRVLIVLHDLAMVAFVWVGLRWLAKRQRPW